MAEDKMDAIVVGAGVAGCAAAIKLASAGQQVLLVDRAKPIGSKNLSGGVIWGHDLEDVLPGWWKEGLAAGAIERPITQKGVNFLTKESGFTIQFGTEAWKREPHNAFTVLRAKFDKWLSEAAAAKGAMVVDGVNVEKLARDKTGRVVGVEQGGDVINADVVILADGCNSRLGMELGIRGKLDRHHYVLGVKEVIQLDEKRIQERFHVGPNEGVAHEYVLGYLENGAKAGGFLYTNRDTISLGVVISLDSIWEKGVYTHKIMEDFRLHPSVAPLLAGGDLVEYGAHLIPEGGLHCVPQLYGDGWLVVGDAAGFVYSNGLVIHGMNYAVRSGILAAEAVLEAKTAGAPGAKSQLWRYADKVERSFILQDLKKFDGMHEFVWDDNIHGPIPRLVEGIFTSLFTADGKPKRLAREIALEEIKKQGLSKIGLAKTALKGAGSV
ncbi:MAG TPA: FAD-dependent oxidoreductase [Candidatus Thermoplasmatota archaeon]|nr:FAD-dependent oxidoreductase [Candidatus Thermoplasmatota archaeon]